MHILVLCCEDGLYWFASGVEYDDMVEVRLKVIIREIASSTLVLEWRRPYLGELSSEAI